MTAVNVFATSQAGYLSADAAVWNADGTLREIASKIIVVPAAKTAVGARGIFSQGFLRFALSSQQTVESVIDAAEKFAKRNKDRVAADRSWSGWEGGIEIYGVSWHGGEAVSWVISDTYPETMKVIGLRYSPDVDLSAAVGRDIASSAAFAALDPKTGFLDLMVVQRRLLIETTVGGMHCVGGRCDLATVTADGVKVETLKVWPDRIGRRITP